MGDRVDVELRHIDKDVYHYFYTLQLNTHSNINPESNINAPGFLGCFAAYYASRVTSIYESGLPADEESKVLGK